MDQASRNDASLPPLRLISIAWGDPYVSNYLEYCLPAALAAGNLPALLPHFSCEVVLVTESKYFDRVREHASYRAATRLCPMRLVAVDDLVATTPDSYGMSITYAFFRGFQDLGPRMTECTLVFLHADFIVAEHSLASLVPHLLRGERLIFAPSYCTIEQNVKPLLRARRAAHEPALGLDKRSMAALILANRHNTIRAKTVNQRFLRLPYLEQFYWAVNEATLLGHQLPIALVAMKPERHLDDVNALWDYGVIAEFCPSMKFTVLADSDDFLLMELRDRDTAKGELYLGWWPTPEAIATVGAAFITEYARLLGRTQLTLHSKDLPPDIDAHRKQLSAFVDSVYAKLPKKLPSHLDHPQWTYHYARFHKARARFLARDVQKPSENVGRGHQGDRILDAGVAAQIVGVTSRLLEDAGLQDSPAARAFLETVRRGQFGPAPTEGSNGPTDIGRSNPCLADLLRTTAYELHNRLEEEAAQRRTAFEQAMADFATRSRTLRRAMVEQSYGFEAWRQPQLPQNVHGIAARISRMLFGTAPRYRPWHWMHSRSRLAVSLAQQHISPQSRVLFLYQSRLLADLASAGRSTVSASVWATLHPEELYERLGREPRFDCCLVEADSSELPRLRRIFDAVRPLMTYDGHFIAVFFNNSDQGLKGDPELLRDAFPACGPARIAYTGCRAAARAMATRTWLLESLQGSLGFSVAHAIALFASAPLAFASSLLERNRTMENSHVPVSWVTSITLYIKVG